MQQSEEKVDYGRLVERTDSCGVAADGRPDDREDARADDGSDAQRGERDGAEGFLERVLRGFGVRDQLVDRFGGEDLAAQVVPSRLK
jgi:hypothetical protein